MKGKPRAVDQDPHSFSLLDPDPGKKNFQIKNRKNARKSEPVIIAIAQPLLFLTCLQSFMFFQLKTTLHKVVFYNFLKLYPDPDLHLKSSWIRTRIEKIAGS